MEIIIKYHNSRMLLTIDLNEMAKVLVGQYGEGLSMRFLPMDEVELRASSKVCDGITSVTERFWILEVSQGNTTRRTDLEHAIVNLGQK